MRRRIVNRNRKEVTMYEGEIRESGLINTQSVVEEQKMGLLQSHERDEKTALLKENMTGNKRDENMDPLNIIRIAGFWRSHCQVGPP